jgi:hypothetical protein
MPPEAQKKVALEPKEGRDGTKIEGFLFFHCGNRNIQRLLEKTENCHHVNEVRKK